MSPHQPPPEGPGYTDHRPLRLPEHWPTFRPGQRDRFTDREAALKPARGLVLACLFLSAIYLTGIGLGLAAIDRKEACRAAHPLRLEVMP